MERLLCLLSGMNAGGAETFLMKIYRCLDKSKYQMDFCVNKFDKGFYDDEILSLGGRIFHIPSKSINVKEFKKQLTEIIKNNHYERVMRITSNAMGFMDLKIAKKAGAKVTIARSSNSSDGGSWKSRAAHCLGRLLYKKYIDVQIAPSDLAAEYTFGKRAVRDGKVEIFRNGLDFSEFRFDEYGRNAVRSEFGINEDTLVVGHVGRFDQQKNHNYLLEIFAEYKAKNQDTVLLLVGKGEREEDIRDLVNQKGIADSVIFAGIRKDIPRVLSAMDLFVFPSLYEGMPNTVIEAQATGLPCIIADTITREADISGLVNYLPINTGVSEWVSRIEDLKEKKTDRKTVSIKAEYNILNEINHFEKLVFYK